MQLTRDEQLGTGISGAGMSAPCMKSLLLPDVGCRRWKGCAEKQREPAMRIV